MRQKFWGLGASRRYVSQPKMASQPGYAFGAM
jgi:hypothetical protein